MSICARLAFRLAGIAMAGCLLAPGIARAQSTPDLNDLVLDWARGRYSSPVHCEMDGKTIRGLRRILITPGPVDARPPVDLLHFLDMQVDGASRCFSNVGESIPNLLGKLQIRLPGRSHPETAARDFKAALRLEHGFDFQVVEGVLRVQEIADPAPPFRHVDFRGGRVGLHMIAPATDAAREIAEFQSQRKALLELLAPDGTRISLPIFLTAPR